MNGSTIVRICGLSMLWAFGWMVFGASAEVFYAGQRTGLPGDPVELSINARGGTVLESIDIVPEYDAVASVLHFVSLTSTTALSDGGVGDCPGQVCGFFYVPDKSFASDTLLATLRFTIDPGASAGPVAFDPGVAVGDDHLAGTNFQVLAVPEPTTWAMFMLGLLSVACAIRHRRRYRGQARA